MSRRSGRDPNRAEDSPVQDSSTNPSSSDASSSVASSIDDKSSTSVLDDGSNGQGGRRERGQGRGRSRGRGRDDLNATVSSNDDITGITTSTGSGSESKRGYTFDLEGDTVINVRRVRGNRIKFERIDEGETWTFDGSHLIQTQIKPLGTEIKTYSDADGDNVYSRLSEVFQRNNALG